MKKTMRFNIVYLLIAILGVFTLHDLWVGIQSGTPLAYSEFQNIVRDGNFKEVVITSNEIRGEFKEPDPESMK